MASRRPMAGRGGHNNFVNILIKQWMCWFLFLPWCFLYISVILLVVRYMDMKLRNVLVLCTLRLEPKEWGTVDTILRSIWLTNAAASKNGSFNVFDIPPLPEGMVLPTKSMKDLQLNLSRLNLTPMFKEVWYVFTVTFHLYFACVCFGDDSKQFCSRCYIFCIYSVMWPLFYLTKS